MQVSFIFFYVKMKGLCSEQLECKKVSRIFFLKILFSIFTYEVAQEVEE